MMQKRAKIIDKIIAKKRRLKMEDKKKEEKNYLGARRGRPPFVLLLHFRLHGILLAGLRDHGAQVQPWPGVDIDGRRSRGGRRRRRRCFQSGLHQRASRGRRRRCGDRVERCAVHGRLQLVRRDAGQGRRYLDVAGAPLGPPRADTFHAVRHAALLRQQSFHSLLTVLLQQQQSGRERRVRVYEDRN